MMVAARRTAWIPHAVLIAGLALVLFPIYVALVASSHELPDILEAPMTLVPGSRLLANLREALAAGTVKTSDPRMMRAKGGARRIMGGRPRYTQPRAFQTSEFQH